LGDVFEDRKMQVEKVKDAHREDASREERK
jgi:hypothetical protein